MNSDLTSFDKIQQKIGGSRKISNYIIGGMLTIGGIGFLLASLSSYTGRDLLPLGNPSTLLFIPQGIIMGAYGIIANLLNFYLWYLVFINFGSGSNITGLRVGHKIIDYAEVEIGGQLMDKQFYDMNDMNEIKLSSLKTENKYGKKSFVYDFLSSMRQKINDPLGKRKKP